MKKKIRKILQAVFCVMLLGLLLTSCNRNDGQEEEQEEENMITIGFSQLGAESDWRIANTESMQAAFSEEKGYELIYDDAQQKQENQIMAIRSFIQQEVDYIVLAPVKEADWDMVLQEAKDAGIPVILVDRMVDTDDDSLYTAWVGSDFKLEGRKAAAWLKDYLEKTGRGEEEINIVNIQGTIGASAQIGRTFGLEEAVKENDNWHIIAQQSGEFTQAKGREVMASLLQQYGDEIDVVYCENDNEAFGVIEAIEASGRKAGTQQGEIMVLSFDTTKEGLVDTLNKKIACNVECNPLHGPRIEELVRRLENGEQVEKQVYVEEEMFSADDVVEKVTVNDISYAVTPVTKKIIDARTY